MCRVPVHTSRGGASVPLNRRGPGATGRSTAALTRRHRVTGEGLARPLDCVRRSRFEEVAIVRVFVAGGRGVVAPRLVPQLVARGYQVTATTTSRDELDRLTRMGETAVVTDGLNAASAGEAVARARRDAIVHRMTAIAPAHAGRLNPRHPVRWVDRDRGRPAGPRSSGELSSGGGGHRVPGRGGGRSGGGGPALRRLPRVGRHRRPNRLRVKAARAAQGFRAGLA